MLPEIDERIEWGLHLVGFTRYGKEVGPGAPDDPKQGTYTFTPYNDIEETLGFNLISHSSSTLVGTLFSSESSIRGRRTWSLGWLSDVPTEFFQNRFAHAGNLNPNQLRYIPRRPTDTPAERSGAADTDVFPLIAGFSDEVFLYLSANRRYLDGETMWDERVRSPLFVGAGYALSTINQEVFVHAGSDIVRHHFPSGCLKVFCLQSAGVGAMARGGVLLPGLQMKDLTPFFVNMQGVFGVTLSVGAYPIHFEGAATSATGYFVRPRTDEEWEMVAERLETNDRTDAWRVYGAKRPMHELFFSGRARIGRVTFEYLNDSLSGKDKGPSFAVGASLQVPVKRDLEQFGGGQ